MLRDVVEDGDIVQMVCEAFVGGSPVVGSKADCTMIEVGGEGYLPGFSEGLLGAKMTGERAAPTAPPPGASAARHGPRAGDAWHPRDR